MRLQARTVGCHPVVLRWRRPRPAVGVVPRPIVVTRRVAIWQPHLHFHLSPPATRVHERERLVHLVRAVERVFRVVRQRHQATAWLHTTSVQTRWRSASLVESGPPVSAAGLRRPSSTPSIFVGPVLSPAGRGLRGWARAGAIDASSPARSIHVSRPDRPRSAGAAVAWRRRSGERRLTLGSASHALVARARREDAERDPVHRHAPVPPAQIVWRQGVQPRAAMPEHVIAASRVTNASRSAAGTPLPDETTTPERSASSQRPRAIRYADLEPGLVDRLTTDVIYRVERRIRIERERRGLS